MRPRPTALGWIDPVVTGMPEWDAAQVRRLARRLGYALVWPPDITLVPLVDQVRGADVDAVITPVAAASGCAHVACGDVCRGRRNCHSANVFRSLDRVLLWEAGMMSWSTAGLVLAAGVPLAVLVWALCWPVREPQRKPKRKWHGSE